MVNIQHKTYYDKLLSAALINKMIVSYFSVKRQFLNVESFETELLLFKKSG